MIERRVAALVAGTEAGWFLWSAALRGLEIAVEQARTGRSAFAGWPRGELSRLLVSVDEALEMAALAVDLREVVTGEEDRPEAWVRHEVAELLLKRARATAAARELPETNFHLEAGYNAKGREL